MPQYPSGDACRVCKAEQETLSTAAAYVSGILVERMRAEGVEIPLCKGHRMVLEHCEAVVKHSFAARRD